MLFAGLQSQHVAGLLLAAFLDRLPDKSSRQEAHILLFRRRETKGRTAVTHGVAKAHQLTYGNIGSVLTWGSQHAQRCRFGDIGNKNSLSLVSDWLNSSHILNAAEEIGLLDDYR